jgi:hypothetical protein
MLVKTALSTSNNTYQASLEVTVDSLETAYMNAYGEPRVDLAGTIPYAGTPIPTSEATLSVTTDLGAPPVAGSVTAQPGISSKAKSISASGTFPNDLTSNPGTFHGAPDVVGDFQLDLTIASVAPVPNVEIGRASCRERV